MEIFMKSTKKFIRLPSVIERTGYRRTAIYEKIAEGSFPRPVQLGPRAIAWVEEEIQEWMNERISERDSVSIKHLQASKTI